MDEFWKMKAKHLAERTLPLIVVEYKGHRNLYIVGEVKAGWQGRGHGGQEFLIRLLENELVFSCNNLWHNGEISKKMWNQFMPNAEFYVEDVRSPTTPLLWDCECRVGYHHPKSCTKCTRCGAHRDDQPDAMKSEVTNMERVMLWTVARNFLSNGKHKCRWCGELFAWRESMDPWYCSESCREASLTDLYANVPPGVGIGLNDMQRQVDEQ